MRKTATGVMIEDFLEQMGVEETDDNIAAVYIFLEEILLYLFQKPKSEDVE